MEKIKLQKYISECGVMSRRAAEKEISLGNITVNGVKAGIGDRIDPDNDTICLNGEIITKTNSGDINRCTYILLNKPSGYVTTLSDEKGRKTVSELIADTGVRLYPVGRLDLYSDGLLLCTNDGDLTNKITHPSHNIDKRYIGIITSHLDEKDMAELAIPFETDGYMLKPFGVRFIEHLYVGNARATKVEFTLHEGRNREIRKICAHHGYKLARLTRIAIGKLELAGIPSGKWRYLTDDEITYLKSI